MADYKTSGAHWLNHWLWSRLNGWVYKGTMPAFDAYGTGFQTPPNNKLVRVPLTPIIPSQQVPEFTDLIQGPPFIVYNYTSAPAADSWWETNENNVYVIYDADEERLRAIHNYMIDLLRREEWTVREINDYLAGQTPEGAAFEFKDLSVTSSSGPDQFQDEGGRQAAMIVVRYRYTRDLVGVDGNGLRAG